MYCVRKKSVSWVGSPRQITVALPAGWHCSRQPLANPTPLHKHQFARARKLTGTGTAESPLAATANLKTKKPTTTTLPVNNAAQRPCNKPDARKHLFSTSPSFEEASASAEEKLNLGPKHDRRFITNPTKTPPPLPLVVALLPSCFSPPPYHHHGPDSL